MEVGPEPESNRRARICSPLRTIFCHWAGRARSRPCGSFTFGSSPCGGSDTVELGSLAVRTQVSQPLVSSINGSWPALNLPI